MRFAFLHGPENNPTDQISQYDKLNNTFLAFDPEPAKGNIITHIVSVSHLQGQVYCQERLELYILLG
jgi:hypothetical protein